MPGSRHPNVVHWEEVDAAETKQGTRFRFIRRQLGAAAGGRALGASLMEVPAGKTAWPMHYHCANEEALFVIQGAGVLRIGEEKVKLRAGDYVAFPPGAAAAHQIVNDTGGPLVYLAFSTMIATDVSVYTDSGKIGVFAGSAPGGPSSQRFLSGFWFRDDAVDYLEGEELDEEEQP